MKALLVSAMLLTLTACGQTGSSSTNEQNTEQVATSQRLDLGPDEFQSMMEAESGQLIDCRTPGEYAGGHLQNSSLMDYNGSNFEEQISTLDKEQTVYIYCRSGGRSGRAASMLESMGFQKVVNLDGGILAWQAQGKEVVK